MEVRTRRRQAPRGGGAHVRSDVRKEGIRFDDYVSAAAAKGETMKIVLAEKVSPSTLQVFAAEPGWEVLTHDNIAKLPGGLEAALADARRAGGPQRGAGGRRADGKSSEAARDRARRRGRGQH